LSGSNEIEQDVAGEFDRVVASTNGTITYRRLASTWFVISWQDSNTDEIGYQKTFVGSSSQNTFIFVYPADQKKQYDPVLARIAKSFHPGDLSHAW
jgi:hypothetical protein